MIEIQWKFKKWDDNVHILPEVPQTLLKLKEMDYLLGIISNGSQRLLKKRFKPYLYLFDILVDSKSLKYKKPSPIPLLYAVNKLNTTLHDTIIVGDTLVDILAAQKAKMEIVLTKTGVFGEPPLDHVNKPPVAIIPVVGKDLLKFLKANHLQSSDK